MGLLNDIGAGPVGLDTTVFIYWIEEHPDFAPLLEPLFLALEQDAVLACTSELTLLETLVVPFQAGDLDLAAAYEEILTGSPGLVPVPIGRSVLREAARLRGARGVRAPDAIQLATALQFECSAFVGNDRRLPDLAELQVLQLDAYR